MKNTRQTLKEGAYVLFLFLLPFLGNAQNSNVGINTATPQKKLHVAGDLQVDGEIVTGGNATTVAPSGAAGALLTSQGAGKAPIWKSAADVKGSVSYMRYVQGTSRVDVEQGNTAAVGVSQTITVPAGITQTVMVTIVGYAVARQQTDTPQGTFELWVDNKKVSSAYCSTASNNPPNASTANSLYSLPIPVTLIRFVNGVIPGNHTFEVRYSAWRQGVAINLDPNTYAGYSNDKECMLTRMTLLVYND